MDSQMKSWGFHYFLVEKIFNWKNSCVALVCFQLASCLPLSENIADFECKRFL